jgi:thioredoxin
MLSMKKYFIISAFILSLFIAGCNNTNNQGNGGTKNESSTVVVLTNDSFKKLIFDYDKSQDFKFAGTRPAIIDFYADWCAPCRQLSPLVESIAEEYKGKIDVYKVDTEKEKLLAQNLGITGLPTLLFIPAEGMPRSSLGLISREDMVKAVNDILLIK